MHYIEMSVHTTQPRASAPSNPVRVRFGAFELDESNATLLCNGNAVDLAPTPFAVLCALVRQPGSLLTKHALLDQVWGHRFVSDSVLKTAISDLRASLNDDARCPHFIETVSLGALIALLGCHFRLQAERSAAGVGSATTGAVVASIVGIIGLDAVFAVCANALGVRRDVSGPRQPVHRLVVCPHAFRTA